MFLEQTNNRFLKKHNWNNFENTITYDFFFFKVESKKKYWDKKLSNSLNRFIKVTANKNTQLHQILQIQWK